MIKALVSKDRIASIGATCWINGVQVSRPVGRMLDYGVIPEFSKWVVASFAVPYRQTGRRVRVMDDNDVVVFDSGDHVDIINASSAASGFLGQLLAERYTNAE